MAYIESNVDDGGKAPRFKLEGLISFMIFFFLIGTGSLLYLVKRINWLLIEKDDELRYRSMKLGDDDVLKDQNDGNNADEANNNDAPNQSFSSNRSYKNRNQMF
jgi:hypothetical protein